MTTVAAHDREPASAKSGGREIAIVAVLALLALTAWAGTAGQDGEIQVKHPPQATVETVAGSDLSVVTLTSDAAEKIGLAVVRVEPADHQLGGLAVPYAAVVHGADGTTWVYASAGSVLRFRRQVVEVTAVEGPRAILTAGPSVGTDIASIGSAELYGAEFEIGH